MGASAFELLDLPVVHGRAEELALGTGLTYARLLEDVAAVAGALQGLGVAVGDEVAVVLDHPHRVVAALAVARLGALPVVDAPVRFVGSSVGPVLHHEGREFGWDLVLKAGRTDPASAVIQDPPGLAEALARFLP